MHIDLEQAEKAIAAARKEAIHLKTKMCIAVVDSGANLRAFIRMDDAWVGSIDIAIKKAKTACFFTMGSGEIGKLSQPGKPLYGIEHSNGGLITFPGGSQGCCRRLQGLGRERARRPSLCPHDEARRLADMSPREPAWPREAQRRAHWSSWASVVEFRISGVGAYLVNEEVSHGFA